MICFEDEEWHEYCDMSKRAATKPISDEQIEIQACLDCTVKFQSDSLKKNLCRPASLGITPIWRMDETTD